MELGRNFHGRRLKKQIVWKAESSLEGEQTLSKKDTTADIAVQCSRLRTSRV